ncbi:AAA family ATPase [Sphingomonas sp. PB1R3]|uniref:AAA family ATPase n=1 Tax=Sphingomonas flavida TaxID=3096154 RepID=UPI002FCC8AE0
MAMRIRRVARAPQEAVTARRLSSFRVAGLFGSYDYYIPINTDERITAIIAPNGYGKTLCLRMIDSLFSGRWSVFVEYKFADVEFVFTDGSRILINKDNKRDDPDFTTAIGIRVTAIAPDGGKSAPWRPRTIDGKVSYQLERYLPFLTRIAPNMWTHDHTGEAYSLQQVVENFSDSIPAHITESIFGKVPAAVAALIDKIDCHLIETQRLLVMHKMSDSREFRIGGRRPAPALAISKKAQTLKTVIGDQLTAYAALSQSLDRSFPRRVISQTSSIPEDQLKTKLDVLDEKRQRLMAAGILDTEADDPVSFPSGPMEPAISRVLSVYADDTEEKLGSLSKLLSRISLFRELVNERFVTKDVHVNRENGIDVSFNGSPVPLEKLSSGEQHQLVLFFELLFEIDENSLILIDEPELSLHVSWQKKFISDLKKIINLNKFDTILATHSPQLIGRWQSLVVELGDVDEDDTYEISMNDEGVPL